MSCWTDSEDIEKKKTGSASTPMVDFLTQPLGLRLRTMILREKLWNSKQLSTKAKAGLTRYKKMDHWVSLKELCLLFPRKKTGRYAVIYIWKMLERLAPSFRIGNYVNPRSRRYCNIRKIPSSPFKIRVQYCNSLGLKCPQMFNILPGKLRNLHDINAKVFKEHLDWFLSEISEVPTSWQET